MDLCSLGEDLVVTFKLAPISNMDAKQLLLEHVVCQGQTKKAVVSKRCALLLFRLSIDPLKDTTVCNRIDISLPFTTIP